MARRNGSSISAVTVRMEAADSLLREGLHRSVVAEILAGRYRRSARQARRYVARVYESWNALGPDDPRREIDARRRVAAATADGDLAGLTRSASHLARVLERQHLKQHEARLELYDAAVLAYQDPDGQLVRLQAVARRAGLLP